MFKRPLLLTIAALLSIGLVQCSDYNDINQPGVYESQIDTRQYALIPNYNNDNCFSCANTDVEFTGCSVEALQSIYLGRDDATIETGREIICDAAGYTTDEDNQECQGFVTTEIFIEIAERYEDPYELLDSISKTDGSTRFVEGAYGEDVIMIDFLDGQLQDFYYWQSFYCYDPYSTPTN